MSERELVPSGYYKAVAVPVELEDGETAWAQFGETSTGNAQVVITFEIVDGLWQGHRLPWFGSLSTKTPASGKAPAYERTLQSLRYCGFKGDDLMRLPEQPLEQEVSITVEHNEYEGKVNARVAWVNKPGGGGVRLQNRMGNDQLRHFAAQMRSRLKAIPAVEGKKVERGTTNGAPASTPAADDDIPF